MAIGASDQILNHCILVISLGTYNYPPVYFLRRAFLSQTHVFKKEKKKCKSGWELKGSKRLLRSLIGQYPSPPITWRCAESFGPIKVGFSKVLKTSPAPPPY